VNCALRVVARRVANLETLSGIREQRMRKRLRKKLHRAEYREFGFDLDWKFSGGLEEQQVESFWDDLIEFVEQRGLILGGGGNQEAGGVFITKSRAPGADTDDRAAVLSWVQQQPKVAEVAAGVLVDARAWKDSNTA
jgi:uncharacterized protein